MDEEEDDDDYEDQLPVLDEVAIDPPVAQPILAAPAQPVDVDTTRLQELQGLADRIRINRIRHIATATNTFNDPFRPNPYRNDWVIEEDENHWAANEINATDNWGTFNAVQRAREWRARNPMPTPITETVQPIAVEAVQNTWDAYRPTPVMYDTFRREAEELIRRNNAAFLNEEQRETRRNMNYDQLIRRSAAMADRYFPDLSNKDNAFSALQAVESDRDATPEDKAALREYVGNHTTPSGHTYQWCNDCESMVGHANHTHCPYCIYPCLTAPLDLGGQRPPTAQHIAACGFCDECCRAKGHRYCPACNVHSERLCRHCGNCEGCCACRLCPVRGCQEMQECEDCHRCFDHCTCPAPRANGPYGKTFPAFKKNERKLFDCQRLAGIEWEFNRLSTWRYFDHWVKKWLAERHEDASCGFEAVTAPVAGDHMIKCVSALGEVFTKSRAIIDNRCSIHVHADAKDLQWADMFRFLRVYTMVEPILYMIAGQERLDNRYCVPCGKDYTMALDRIDRKDAIMAVAFTPITREGRKSEVNLIPDNGRMSQRLKPGKRADMHMNCRRKGLNILPWLAGRGPRPKTPVTVLAQANDTIETVAQRNNVSIAALMRWNKMKPGTRLVNGQRLTINKRVVAPDTTIEFRIHPNTNDAARVINWAKIVLRLVDWAAKSTDKDLENLPKSALRVLCQVIAPECAPWIMSRVKEWRKETSANLGHNLRRISLKGGKYSY